MRGIKPSLVLAALGVVGPGPLGGRVCRPDGEPDGDGRRPVPGSRSTRTRRPRPRFAFDSPERLNWHFIPRPRKGLPIKEMTPAQRALAFGLLQTGLAGSGFLKATTIMSLEQILQRPGAGRAGRSATPSCTSSRSSASRRTAASGAGGSRGTTSR